jgi:hypothetical protein
MPVRSGRLEKRIRMAIPVQISSPLDPAAELNERLMISSVAGDLRTLARVVYCERLPDGRFGVGLQFQGMAISWPNDSLAGAAD